MCVNDCSNCTVVVRLENTLCCRLKAGSGVQDGSQQRFLQSHKNVPNKVPQNDGHGHVIPGHLTMQLIGLGY